MIRAIPILFILAAILLMPSTACRRPAASATPTPTPVANEIDQIPDVAAIYVHPSGNDSNEGTEDSPLLTISAAITKASSESLTQVRVAEGDYSIASGITLVAGISVYGGFKSDDFGVRNASAYPTSISDSRTSGGTAIVPTGAVLASGALGNLVFDGFTVEAASGSYSAAIYASTSYHVTFSHNTLRGGSATLWSYGVYTTGDPVDTIVYTENTIEGGSAPSSVGVYKYASDAMVTDNDIDGGTGTNTYGVYLRQITNGTVSENRITAGLGTNTHGVYITSGGGSNVIDNEINGGTATTNSYGFYISTAVNPVPTIRGNTIHGGTATSSHGIYNVSHNSIIDQNRIFGGTGTHTYGVVVNSAAPILSNNLISGGEATDDAYGVYLVNPGSPVVRNNTINGGQGATSGGAANRSSAIHISSANNPTFENNLLFTHAGASQYCLYDGGTIGTLTMQNNALFDCPNRTYKGVASCTSDNDGDANNTTCNVDDLNELANHGGNVESTPSFTDADGADGNALTVEDNDWSLANATPSDIKDGGLNGGGLGWSFTDDFAGTARTNPWSIGAYEKD